MKPYGSEFAVGGLLATKGNDGQLRIRAADLDDLPPPDIAPDDHVRPEDDPTAAALDVLRSTADDLRSAVNKLTDDLDAARKSLDEARVDLMNNHGRAEKAEAQLAAERARADRAETLAAETAKALADARTPLVLRLVRAWRRPA